MILKELVNLTEEVTPQAELLAAVAMRDDLVDFGAYLGHSVDVEKDIGMTGVSRYEFTPTARFTHNNDGLWHGVVNGRNGEIDVGEIGDIEDVMAFLDEFSMDWFDTYDNESRDKFVGEGKDDVPSMEAIIDALQRFGTIGSDVVGTPTDMRAYLDVGSVDGDGQLRLDMKGQMMQCSLQVDKTFRMNTPVAGQSAKAVADEIDEWVSQILHDLAEDEEEDFDD